MLHLRHHEDKGAADFACSDSEVFSLKGLLPATLLKASLQSAVLVCLVVAAHGRPFSVLRNGTSPPPALVAQEA